MTIQLRWNRWRGARVMSRAVCAMAAVSVLGLASCKKEEPAPPPPPPPPPRVEAPKPLDAASVLQSMNVDARVEFAEGAAPVDRGLAEAAIRLADALAQGDDAALRGMLDRSDHGALDKLIGDGQWYEATGRIEAVRVVSIDDGARLNRAPERADVGLAVQDPDGAYIMLWAGRKVLDDWMFTARPATGQVRGRASSWDGVSSAMLADSGPSLGFGGGFGGDFGEGGLSPEILAQLQQLGIDPNNPDPAQLLALLDQLEGVLPPDQLQELRELIESLGGAPAGAGDAGGNDDGGDGGRLPGRDGGRRPGGG
ncbi:MAG: hypothetical protein ACF8LK_02360 [Phycisphaerales bacterium JB041]